MQPLNVLKNTECVSRIVQLSSSTRVLCKAEEITKLDNKTDVASHTNLTSPAIFDPNEE